MVLPLGLRTYQDPDRRKKFESFAEDGGHSVYIDPKHQGDIALCFCGWSGTPYHVGPHHAWIEWRRHVLQISVQNDQEDGRKVSLGNE